MRRTRNVLVPFLLSIFLIAAVSPADSQDKYPSKAINLIQIYGPGSPGDTVTKALCETMKAELGVPIITKYVTGRTGALGADELYKANPDGYTLGIVTLGSMAAVPHTTKVKYDPLKDFEFYGTYMEYRVGWVVKADSPYKNLKDLIEAARKQPEKITFGNGNPGGILGLGVAYVEKVEKVQFKNVPFTAGGAEALTALLGGHIDFVVTNPPLIPQYLKSGHIRMLVSGTNVRHSDLNAPTLRELGYDFDQVSFNVLASPKGVPLNVKKRLDETLRKSANDPHFVKIMENVGTPLGYHSGEEFSKMIVYYHKKWGEILKDNYRF